ncbi:hypothetical protein BGW41_002094 [Actinomortierella wolfii]|nr:hypothetical protein BGW41_002094 [Actinomortierella wolfii]
MPAPPLPIECMQLILEHFDDTFALHSLLLTSKAWFPLVAERLYHDPFTRIHRCKNTPRALSLFLSRVVLCCSPCKDPVVAALRHRFMAETSASTVESRLGGKKTPSIDYLSLVKIIRFSPRVLHAIAHLMERQEPKKPVSKGRKKKRDVNIASSNLSPRTESTEHGQVAQWQIEIEGGDLFLGGMTDMKLEMAKASVSHAIVVAIAEHQFHNIQELQIPRQYLRQYYLQFSVVQALSNLECVIFDLGFGAVYQEMIQNTHDFVREYAGVHGMRRGQFDILYVGGKSVEFLQTFPIIHQTYSLLRPHYTPKYITDYNGGGELIDSLARVQCIQLTRICDQTTVRAVMARLKECRLLKELWVTIDTRGTGTNGNININNSENLSDQSHIFEWAINRTNEVFKSPFVSHTLLLPPLCRVNLSYNGLNPERLIEHLFSAFGPTLEDVNLEIWGVVYQKSAIPGSTCQISSAWT